MTVAKLLSFAATGAMAISPFTLGALSKEKIVSPILKENFPQINTSLERSNEAPDNVGAGGGVKQLLLRA